MYVDLLTRALGKGEEGRRSDDLLMADLVYSRARLRATNGATTVAEALARELSYDGALIRLCQALEVPATPAQFANPERERARLERELVLRGLAFPPEASLDPQPA
jgi:predicted kinase